MVARGDVFREAGDHPEAISWYLRVLGLAAQPAIRDIELKMVALGRDGVPVIRRWAQSLEAMGRYAEVLAVTAPALPFLDEAEPLEAVRLCLVRGKALMEAGRHQESAREAAQGMLHLERRPGGAPAVEEGFLANLLGGLAFRSGRIHEAFRWFQRALEVFKSLGRLREIALGYNNLGQVAKRQGDWRQALEFFQVARSLATTEGAARDRTGALLNLAYIKLHRGQLKEAAADFSQAAREARALGDRLRWQRALLGGVQASRALGDLERARHLLREIGAAVSTPGLRERILAHLEEGWISLEEGRLEEAQRSGNEASLLYAQGSALGEELAGEIRRLQGWVELRSGRPGRAQQLFGEAARSGESASDPVGADAARLGAGVALRLLGQLEAAEIELRALGGRLRSRGERLSLGMASLELGHALAAAPDRRPDAVEAFEEASRIFQELGLVHREAESWFALARALLDEGDLDGARGRLAVARQVRARCAAPGLAEQEAALVERLSRAYERRANAGLSGFDAFRKVEAGFGRFETDDVRESLHEVLGVVRAALEADAALFGLVRGGKVEILASRGMGKLDGRQALPLSSVVPDGELVADRPRIMLGETVAGERAPAARQASALAVPVEMADQLCLLYVERWAESGRPPFQPVEGHYASALAMEVSRGLRRSGWRPSSAVSAALEELARNVYLADIVTQSPSMYRVLELVCRVAPTDMTVLLQGETGTGKRLLAQAIHRVSRRSQRAFVTVDCAALPETLLETELFGYRRGAFTGAARDREGLLGDADGGTIFLDEIGKAGPQVQRRFLHLLDTGEVRPVGATSYRRLDVRIVAATSSPDLSREVEAGRFLKDLYYRINDITVSIPLLRERKNDIPLLAETFAEIEAARLGRPGPELSASVLRALLAHDWPGNVRELEKAIRRAVTLAGEEMTLTPDLLPEEIVGRRVERRRARRPLKEQLEHVERSFILQALEQAGWNKSRAARMLGLSRKGLRNKIDRFRLERGKRIGA